MAPILPGATIGFFGGGQLGRMTAMAARTLGYHVHVLDPSADCAARAVVDRVVAARFDDPDAAAELARHCDVVSLEIEQVGAASLAAAERHAPVRPGARVLEIVRDRSSQKAWLRRTGFPIGDYQDITSGADLDRAVATYGTPLFVKANHGGYDGRGQVRVERASDAAVAWRELAERPSVAERGLALELELSVMVARSPSGAVAVYPPALNHHENQVLAWSVLPAPIAPEIAAAATTIASDIAASIGLEGILAVEMFLTTSGELLVNELAPRPHNSYHTTEVGCVTSQFEQLVRAACDLPLGATEVSRPSAIVNLFGDLWLAGRAPRFDRALAVPHTRVHLYGKPGARAGRKMGHIAAVGATTEEALARAHAAFEAIGIP
ncbi:MAG TPA: 5-(carboxyamino)imidazole ribonucleotide synthase [Gemmatimonadaceae bacterium]|nr:5-(carboxyamino)imidazole ribonucleotide synthase [Gemmatimonadaceae bacterium]